MSSGAEAPAVAPPSTARARLVELDGLRAVAACSILVYHCWIFSSPARLTWNLGPATPFMGPLQSGVTVFFVLSGFLLYLPLARAVLDRSAPPPVGRYLRRRVLRIVPAYWFALGVSALVLRSTLIAVGHGARGAGAVPGAGLFLQDLLLVGNLHPRTFGTGILPAWSLTIEVCFYLSLPLLALLTVRLGRRARTERTRLAAAVAAPLVLIGVGVTTNTVASFLVPGYGPGIGSTWQVVLRQSFLAHADLFGIGAAAAVLYLLLLGGAPSHRALLLRGATGRTLAYLGLPLWVIGYYLLPRTAYDPLVAVFFALAMLRLLVRSREPGARRSAFSRRWFVGCGLASYSVFLWHYPILTFLALHGALLGSNDALAFVVNLVLVATLTGLAAYLTYRFVERPAMRLDGALRTVRLRELAPRRALAIWSAPPTRTSADPERSAP
jgi:peptidoglycan/LPS O-acetylase OafA/YrhL